MKTGSYANLEEKHAFVKIIHFGNTCSGLLRKLDELVEAC